MDGGELGIHRIAALAPGFEPARLPYTLRVLLENVVRSGDERGIRAIVGWDPAAEPADEIAFFPSRVLLQDFTGVPAVVDLAAMRDAIAALGGDPAQIDPLIPAETGRRYGYHSNDAQSSILVRRYRLRKRA